MLPTSALYTSIAFVICILVVGTNLANGQVVQYQILDPTSLVKSPVLFGSGVAITPDGRNIAAIGFDSLTSMQFLSVYPIGTSQYYQTPTRVFLGDLVSSNTFYPAGNLSVPINQTNWFITPLCISQDMQYVAFGYRSDGFNSSGSILIATKAPTDPSAYVLVARLYSDLLPGQSLFPFDMVCQRNMSTIYVTETSFLEAAQKFIRLTVYTQTNGNAWVINRTEDYWNGTDVNAAPLALLQPSGDYYAVRSSNPQLVYLRSSVDGSLDSVADLSPLGIVPNHLALSNNGRRLVVADSTCSAQTGCIYVLDYNDTITGFNANVAVKLTTAINTTSSGLGFSLSMSGNSTSDTGTAGLLAGMPYQSNSLGATLAWKPLYNSTSGTFVWTSGAALMSPFGPNVPNNSFTGGTLVTHNLISDNELVAVYSGPSNGFTASGEVYIVRYPMPSVTLAPTSLPVAPPTTPTATQGMQAVFLVMLIFAIVTVTGGVVVAVIYSYTYCCARKVTKIRNAAN